MKIELSYFLAAVAARSASAQLDATVQRRARLQTISNDFGVTPLLDSSSLSMSMSMAMTSGIDESHSKVSSKSNKSGKGSKSMRYAERCLEAYEASGYTRLATSNFSQWFDDDSQVQYAPAGIYTGADGIAEYFNFFVTPLLYDATTKVNAVSPEVVSATNNKCVILVAEEEQFELNGDGNSAAGVPPLTVGSTINSVVGQKVEFEVVGDDEDNILVKRIDLYLPPGYGAVTIAQAIIPTLAGFFCQAILFTACPDIWEANFGMTTTYPTDPTQNPCLGALSLLPAFEPADDPSIGGIDGDSVGCRLLHGSFAATNPFHCPHISFSPIADGKGNFVCQTTNGFTVEDFFTEDELNFMYGAAVEFLLDGEPIPGIRVTNS